MSKVLVLLSTVHYFSHNSEDCENSVVGVFTPETLDEYKQDNALEERHFDRNLWDGNTPMGVDRSWLHVVAIDEAQVHLR